MAYDQKTEAANASKDMLAFILERNNERYVVYWHTTGNGTLDLPLNPQDVTLEKEQGGEPVPFAAGNSSISVRVADRCYLKSSLTRQQLIDAFKKAVLH